MINAKIKHSRAEFDVYSQHQLQPSAVEKDFENSLKMLNSIESSVEKKKGANDQ